MDDTAEKYRLGADPRSPSDRARDAVRNLAQTLVETGCAEPNDVTRLVAHFQSDLEQALRVVRIEGPRPKVPVQPRRCTHGMGDCGYFECSDSRCLVLDACRYVLFETRFTYPSDTYGGEYIDLTGMVSEITAPPPAPIEREVLVRVSTDRGEYSGFTDGPLSDAIRALCQSGRPVKRLLATIRVYRNDDGRCRTTNRILGMQFE